MRSYVRGLLFLVGNTRHESGNQRHGWQSGTYEAGNEGHQKIKLAMTDIWLVMRYMRLAVRDITKIRVGNERQPKSELAKRDMNIIK